MAYRTTYTAKKKFLDRYAKHLEAWGLTEPDLPLRRTDRRYRRRCSTCCRFLAREVKGAYCRTCNAARRRRDRLKAACERDKAAYFQRAYGQWGSSNGEVMAYLLQDNGYML